MADTGRLAFAAGYGVLPGSCAAFIDAIEYRYNFVFMLGFAMAKHADAIRSLGGALGAMTDAIIGAANATVEFGETMKRLNDEIAAEWATLTVWQKAAVRVQDYWYGFTLWLLPADMTPPDTAADADGT